MEFVHSPLAKDGRPIRLLVLEPISPISDSSSDIRCTLRHVDLDDKPTYKALSYVWGDPNVTFPIFIDEKQYHVTANCHAALVRLREIAKDRHLEQSDDDDEEDSDEKGHSNEKGSDDMDEEINYGGKQLIVREPTYFWIDAICINQQDDDEKSAQVRLMCQIYRLAEEVITWLGRSVTDRKPSDEDEEELAFGLIRDLTDPGVFEKFETFLEVAQSGDNAKSRWEALAKIFSHPWFDRLWVHQEIVVSSEAIALGQYLSIPWLDLGIAAATIEVHSRRCDTWRTRYLDWGLDPSLGPLITCCGYGRVCGRFIIKANFDEERGVLKGINLLQLLYNVSAYDCSDPRDYVFSAVCLLEEGRHQSILPDYSKTLSEVYTELAWWAIQEYQDLQVLALAEFNNFTAKTGPPLPSWVVDWRSIHEQHRLAYEAYHAALNSKPLVNFCTISSTMEVLGFQIDIVLEMLPPTNPETSYIWMYSGDPLLLWRKHFKEYPTGCDPVHAWIRTATADVDNKKRRLTQSLFRKFEARERMTESSYISEIEQVFTEENSGTGDWVRCLRETFIEYIETMSIACASRRFFVSEKGYMGIGPESADNGDMICVLLGCQVPVLIRKHHDYQLFIGECFVWGIMDGEAIRDREERNGYETFRLR